PAQLLAALALLVGSAVAACYVRFSAIKTLFTLSAVAFVAFPAAFLFFSPVAQAVFESGGEVLTGQERAREDIPIVFLVFDEFPVTSIMDGRGEIDESAVPNFAALARTATWYRNASSVSDYTTAALPAILTGTYPREYRRAHVSNYPGNLFTLLARSHDMHVIEPFTDLCPAYLVSDDIEGASWFERVASLASDVWLIYLHYLLPRDWTGTLPDVTKTLKDFADGSRTKRSQESRITYYEKFLRGIRPGSKPSLNFLHIMIPHVPWVYYPSGKRYNDYHKGHAGIFGLEEGERWKEDPWAVNRAFQRHLLQVSFVDKLLGRCLQRLKSQDLFDRSLIVVTADHGVSFVAGGSRRRLTESNFQDLVGVPLFIKAPRQRSGVVDDRVVETIDILPTIASILGMKVPWPVDGVNLTDDAPTRSKRTVYHYGERIDESKKFVQNPAVGNWNSTTVKQKADLFGANPNLTERYFNFGPHRDLIGTHVSHLRVEHGDQGAELLLDNEGFFADMDPTANFLFGNISGVLQGWNGRGLPSELAVAVNGTIRAVTRTIPVRNDEEAFSAVVPEDSFRSGRNAVEVFIVKTRSDGRVSLESLRKGRSKTFSIATPPGRIAEVLESSDGDRIPVIHGSLVGRLDHVLQEESGDTEFIGWAADKANSQPAGELLVFADGQLVRKVVTNWHMPAVALFLGGPQFVNSGYWFSLPTKMLKDVTELRLFAVSSSDPKVASEVNYRRGYQWAVRPGRFTITTPEGSEPETVIAPNGARIPVRPGAVDGQVESTTEKDADIVITGWAVEANNRQIPHLILVFADGEAVRALKPNVFRRDVVEYFNAPSLLVSGFKIEVPADVLKRRTHVRVLGVSNDGVASEIRTQQRSK
ncbi:MAG: sulfatase-like hydrolase/transferase, partial [Desulfomonilaceae bacterium]|nr:sulfatase-like hydrolase/transferase [Desulfomonilaceae bacterium]